MPTSGGRLPDPHLPRRGRHRHQCFSQPLLRQRHQFFSADGTKLPDDVELAIEAELDHELKCVESAELGKAQRIDDAAGRSPSSSARVPSSNPSLEGLKMVVDCGTVQLITSPLPSSASWEPR